ncbi:hypothetical protein N7462_003167 [Penicillium macrosclerotiorum]|uniref:uncharacterized protein n=1 Tax=Penicillium macrosclerotiorum TaxID=303699 RepID=UPI002548BB1E|nr:uncharacterized protein N7462_003167 [Penicillium macrosclerotiorum]KAJ5688775.1 hypothetical protein N7462_003167 [Penicillium macrosclerotiorum]
MPAPILTEPLLVVRNMQDDEKDVADRFERHVSHCSQCALSLETGRDALCERGQPRAVDVTKYFYSLDGKHLSVVDKESGSPKRVKLPRENVSTRKLIEHIENGARIHSPRGRAPPVRAPSPLRRSTSIHSSYDQRYPIPPRRPAPVVEYREPRNYTPSPEPETPTRIIERSPSSAHQSPSTSKRRVVIYHSPRGSPSRSSTSRGSLYSMDHQDRVELRYNTTHIRRQSDYNR